MKKTTKKTVKPVCKGSNREVVIRNDKGMYAIQFNVCFGIVVWGEKKDATRLYISDAVDVLKDLRSKGNHVVWLEIIGTCPCGCHKL